MANETHTEEERRPDEAIETITLKGTEYRLPYRTLLPPLAEGEYQALRDDIRENGVIVPVVIDEDQNVIDGEHRLKAAVETGRTDVRFDILPGLTDRHLRRLRG